jgi:hypothetical protein
MHNRLAEPETPVDAAARRPHAAGRIVGDVAGSGGWLVTGTNGENRIHADVGSQAAAWHQAERQAEAVGMIGARQAIRIRIRKNRSPE